MKYLLLALLILCNFITKAQADSDSEYKEGYIITSKGDTTKGFLFKHISRLASEKCIFKATINSKPKTYYPNEIAGYRFIDGKYYVSKEIKTDSTTKKLIFLEFILKGKVNVYYYVDLIEHYYIEKTPEDLVELTEEQKTFHDDEKGRSYYSTSRFKGKLKVLLSDCPAIYNEIQSTRLTHQSLIKLTKDYNEKVCGTDCIVYERKITSSKLKYGILMAYSKNSYNFGDQFITDTRNSFQVGIGIKTSNIFMFNEHLNLKANILFEKDSKAYTVSLADDVHFNHLTYNNVSYNLRNLTSSYDYLPSVTADLNVLDLKVPISLCYDINMTHNTFLTLGIGISNKIILTQNKDFKIDDFYEKYGKSINSLLTGAIISAGLEGKWFGKHTLFLNANYESYAYLARVDPSWRLKNKQMTIELGMYF